MKYTKEQVSMFENMFAVSTEYNCYKQSKLHEDGLIEDESYFEESYSTSQAKITLSNKSVYIIHYGERNDAIADAMEAFNKFIELGYDEKAFEEYLDKESGFSLV